MAAYVVRVRPELSGGLGPEGSGPFRLHCGMGSYFKQKGKMIRSCVRDTFRWDTVVVLNRMKSHCEKVSSFSVLLYPDHMEEKVSA